MRGPRCPQGASPVARTGASQPAVRCRARSSGLGSGSGLSGLRSSSGSGSGLSGLRSSSGSGSGRLSGLRSSSGSGSGGCPGSFGSECDKRGACADSGVNAGHEKPIRGKVHTPTAIWRGAYLKARNPYADVRTRPNSCGVGKFASRPPASDEPGRRGQCGRGSAAGMWTATARVPTATAGCGRLQAGAASAEVPGPGGRFGRES
jgi:hypothetical protein